MKRRSKFNKPTITQRVAECLEKHPHYDVHELAKTLGLNATQVWPALGTIKKREGKEPAVKDAPLNERDIVAVSKIGVATAERIVRLLKQLS